MPFDQKASPSGKSRLGAVSVADTTNPTTDKAIINLMKEHAKLKKRLEIIQQPDFLINLKKDLRTTEEEIK